jgi:secondary thiamine-phosphate synthase enzyme
MFEVIEIESKNREEMISITDKVSEIIRKAKIKEGICVIYVPHTTAGVTINEDADPSVKKDILNHLSKIIPYNESYSHIEGNADAHIKASIIGSSVNVIINNGELLLGRWQGIFFCEFDGPRRRKIYLKIL